MIRLSLSLTNEELLQVGRYWLDVLEAGDYQQVFDNLGYAMAYGEGAHAILRDIRKYRSAKFYPGISEFRVSDWRTAAGGNPEPSVSVRRYPHNDIGLARTIELDLPLNGQWSDLLASFVIFATGPNETEGVLSLEDISFHRDLKS